MGLLDTLAEIIGHLDRAGVPYMVAGSIASTYYGEPRTTQDIDIVIGPTHDSLNAFLSGLDRNRYYVGDAAGAFARQGQFNVIDMTSGWKLDLIVLRDRPFSRVEFERRVRVDIEGLQMHVATAEDTILAKLEWAASGDSERQLRDVEAIVRAVGADLDLRYLQRWAVELGVRGALGEILEASTT